MLDAWIIEKIRERDEKQEDDRPTIQLPVPQDLPRAPKPEKVEPSRGVIVIDIGGREDEEEA